jgi:hypothetical protein
VSHLIKLNKNITPRRLTEDVCGLLFLKMARVKQLHDFLNANNLDFQESVYIKNNLIQLKFSSIRNLLISLNFFENDKLIHNQFVINEKYKKWFVDDIVTLIEDSSLNKNSLKDFKNSQKRREELGLEAEEFVLNYEKRKRNKHPKCNNIRIISEIDVKSGYDIQSYKNDKSTLLDKFIEVKSYSGNPYFYWSNNEVKVAKKENNNYFLYLVNRNEMSDNYSPIMIQNPYENVFNNMEWIRESQNWKFEQKVDAG